MKIVVQKYGGAVMADLEKRNRVADMIIRTREKGKRCVVVVSAPGDMTDDLIAMARAVTDSPDTREMDMLLATGEQQSCALLAMTLKARGIDAESLTGPQAGIVTDNVHMKARIKSVGDRRIMEALRNRKVVIVAGFQGRTAQDDITTLGRGGSDLTAVALASALKAESCEFYKDVPGILTADPRIVGDARRIPEISYDEMLELSSLGAQVLNARSVEYAKNYNVPLFIRSMDSEKGTFVVKEARNMEKIVVSGVTYSADKAKITIRGVQDRPGIAATIFKKIADSGINVHMIVQDVSTSGITSISFTLDRGDLKHARSAMEKICREVRATDLAVDDKVSEISVVGVGMRSHTGVAATLFQALAVAGVNIEMISTSEIKISCVVAQDQLAKAVRAIHKAFKLGGKR